MNKNIFQLPRNLVFFIMFVMLTGQAVARQENPFTGDNPWPDIRKERITKVLPEAMKTAGVDAWIVVCRENNNDPIAHHIGGENAGGTAVFLFYIKDEKFGSIVFSPAGEATALADLHIHDQVLPIPRGHSAISAAAEYAKSRPFTKIAVNSSSENEMADGLSYTQRKNMEEAFGSEAAKFVSSNELLYEWLSIKLPSEVDIMKKAAQLTSDWQYEAYSQVRPGKSTDADIAKFLKNKIAEYGFKDGWAADQNPNVNSGPDRGHSHATDKIIMPGDVIQIDFGIRVYDMWVTDIQRFAYVLRPGEVVAPDSVQQYWENSKQGSRIALSAMRPGVTGYDVDKAQRDFMKKKGSEYVMWSTGHPVGYVAHDVGPSLGGAQLIDSKPRAESFKKLKPGMVFAFDGFFAWKLPDGREKTMSVEEMAVVTADGASYLIDPQEELILIKDAIKQ
ncbi:M24 family metallopeptidase [Anditalea andensis]|uniref:Peptidase M24 n=1 Tax=Anditalea andensis TaxID=1048983 RepID=A0A074KUS6_9BACT|nr:M24 family metallopeptidase [Anditalea andensis]KEO72629.1 peptidase M24 [Anditalea andensis]